MQKTSESSPTRSRVRRRSETRDGSSALAELENRFARFREEHARGTRIPEELRAAVLAALDEGVRPRELHRKCGVSWSQIVAWQARGVGRVKEQAAEPREVRVFSVADEPPMHRSGALSSTAEQELELRFGPWSVKIQGVGSEDGRRD